MAECFFMRKIFFLPILFLLVGCGQSDEEKQNIATITCNVIAETKKDPAMKIKEMNIARENLSAEPYLFGVDKINESLEYDLCENLVLLSEPEYEKVLLVAKEEERKARIKAREEARKATEELRKKMAELEKQEKRTEIARQVREQKEFIIDSLQNSPESYCADLNEFGKYAESILNNEPYSGSYDSFSPSCEYQNWEDEDWQEIVDTYNEYNTNKRCNANMDYQIKLFNELTKSTCKQTSTIPANPDILIPAEIADEVNEN